MAELGLKRGKNSMCIVGAFIMALLLNGMTLMGLGSDVQQMVKGLILLAAVTFDVFARSRSEG